LPKLSLESAFLLQKNLHVLKIKGHRIRLEEIVADHAREVKTKSIFPRKRSIVETTDVVVQSPTVSVSFRPSWTSTWTCRTGT
jgi:hypothetical protein